MSFSLHDFLMNGFRSAIGNLPEYKIYANAAGWLEKGVLNEHDLEEIQGLIDEKNAMSSEEELAPEEPVQEEHPEDNMLSPKEIEGQA
jgi:hypothetical protein